MNVELSQDYRVDQTQEMLWKQAPFQQMSGIEALENMQERGYVASYERSRSIESTYRTLRESLLTPPYDSPTIVGALGASGSGKSSALQGIYRVALSDYYLNSQLRSHGMTLDVVPVPFSLYAEAAKSDGVLQKTPDVAIDPQRSHGCYTEEEYAKISALMKSDMEQYFRNSDSNRAPLILLEPSSPTAIPDAESIRGVDRGLSALYAIAIESQHADRVHVLAIEADKDVSDEVVVFRSKLNLQTQDVFVDSIHVVYTDYHEMEEGDDLDVSELPVPTQQKVQDFVKRTMATPQAKKRSDEELQQLKHELKNEGVIKSTSDRRYFRLIQERLQMPDSRFHYVSNPHLMGRKTYDIDYFIHSLAVRNYPDIVVSR